MIRLRTFAKPAHGGRFRMQQAKHPTRSRGGHDPSCLVVLIDPVLASQHLGISPWILESAATHHLIPHYRIADHIRFDARELDAWVKRHHIDEIGVDEGGSQLV